MRRARLLGLAAGLSLATSLGLAALVPEGLASAAAPPGSVAPPTPAAPGPVAGHLELALDRVGGSPPFALLGGRFAVQGTVSPYVSGQTVKVSIYRQGRKLAVERLSVRPAGAASGPDGASVGTFRFSVLSHYPGLVEARAVHYATPQQAQFGARSAGVQFVQSELGPGAAGGSVRLLQSELDVLHYAVPLSGVLEEGTSDALIAYRKVTGLERVPYAGRQVFELLARHAGGFHVLYPADGRHVEADLSKQVLAEIEPGGRVRETYMLSSGKPSTPTVVGHFHVYEKTFGINEKGMVDSNYFISGYAIHGYAEVPTYAASHGCLRVPIPDAESIYDWIQLGTPVDVYEESGGGSHSVSGNAGP